MKTFRAQIVLLVLIALIPATLAAFFHPRRPSWRSDEVSLSTVRAWGDKVLWLDARDRPAYEREHIPGALLLNEDEWDSLIPEVIDHWSEDMRVVVYCSSLSCQTSREVTKRLRDEVGLPEVYVLKGGWETWKSVK